MSTDSTDSTQATPPLDSLDYSSTGLVFLIPSIVLNVIATIFVALRLYARRFKGLKLQFDDWIVVVALVRKLVKYGMGVNGETVAATYPGGVSNFLELIYATVSPLAKISLLALYYRIFYVSHTIRIAVWVMTVLLISWGISVIFTSIFTCNPIRGFWDLSIGAKCIDSALFFEAITIPNIILDLGTVVLPISEVWKLQIGRDRKLALTAIFTVGSIVVLATIARLITVKLYQPAGGSLNTTHSSYVLIHISSLVEALVPALLSSFFEVNFAIYGACLPPIIPLWRHWFGQPTSSSKNSRSTPPFRSIITIGQRSNRQARKVDTTFEMLGEDSREELTQTNTNYGTEGIALTTELRRRGLMITAHFRIDDFAIIAGAAGGIGDIRYDIGVVTVYK
ncbi:hypothetical protein ABKA04_003454 [Annulohypoxylon sp. FPYF3050]